ncbi:hypothetical protein KIN20_008226 [Parelaphostrongylus tenuis]|uniref:Uncharacterized protein n=1 Tax=Parelaphostrongylus tenuis TaxID=148309 RepID=A0AAD5MQV1_PARTN|nr:hypothetical protein KIN20_008226 [Parelaphostrongylus tenuis]
MDFGYVTMFETDPHHGQQLSDKTTNGNYDGARGTRQAFRELDNIHSSWMMLGVIRTTLSSKRNFGSVLAFQSSNDCFSLKLIESLPRIDESVMMKV